jgi:hypothetical protein
MREVEQIFCKQCNSYKSYKKVNNNFNLCIDCNSDLSKEQIVIDLEAPTGDIVLDKASEIMLDRLRNPVQVEASEEQIKKIREAREQIKKDSTS